MPETRPFRLRILDELERTIRRVNPTNGYAHDLSDEERVIIGRLFLGDDDVTPCVTMVEPPLVVEQDRAQADNPKRKTEWDVIVQGWVPNGVERETDAAYVLAAEVGIEIIKESRRVKDSRSAASDKDILGFGPRIEYLRVGSPVVRPPEHQSSNAQFYFVLTMKIHEDIEDPFR